MQSFKIVAYLLLGCSDSGGYVKFTPKYIIVGGEGGGRVSEFVLRFRSYSFGNSGPHAKFQIIANLLLVYFWLVWGDTLIWFLVKIPCIIDYPILAPFKEVIVKGFTYFLACYIIPHDWFKPVFSGWQILWNQERNCIYLWMCTCPA